MKVNHKWLYILAFLTLALPLVFTGFASARYMDDGAVPNGTGGWVTPNDMVCILGVHMNGNLDVVPGVSDARSCIYYNTGLTGLNPVDVTASTMCGAAGTLACNTSTNCTGTSFVTKGTLTWNATDSKCYDSAPCTVANFAGGLVGGVNYPANDGAKHALATSICVDGTGAGIPLTGLDRTAQMCAAKGGTWKQTSATAPSGFAGTFPTPNYGGSCVAYGRQFAGQNASGTPLAFGTNGTTSAQAGYCYTTLNMTAEATPSYTSTTCPSAMATTAPFNANAAYDWSFTSGQCRYAKAIAGKTTTTIFNADGSSVATGTYIDLSVYTTMGDCIAHGGSWNNWVGTAATSSIVGNDANTYKRPLWAYNAQAPDADNGCLHCHSSLTEYNGPAERQKDTYLKTGHKNMLRKVTTGISWAGPDGVVYTTDGTNAITFNNPAYSGTATVNVSGTDRQLYYIYGDWIAPLPTLLYGTTAVGTIGNTNNYSCYACHATGSSDNTPAVPGVQSIGTVGYAGVQPQASFPGINIGATAAKWDLEGIQCGRCHNAAVGPITATQIAASAFPTTAPHSGGMGALANGTGRNNLCFGCHQSIGKQWQAQGGPLGGATQYDPTYIATGAGHGATWGRDWNGHVLGNSFLNSVHGQYAGVNSNSANGGIKLNALGKYDLFDTNGTSEYGSLFKGYTCWQSPTSTSPAKTTYVGGITGEIKDKTTCESLYGAGSWRADTGNGSASTIQGTCTTCHDVHNSVAVASQEEASIRKKCEDCHVNNATTFATDPAAPQKIVAAINHLGANGSFTAGTPWDTSLYSDACAVCHMALQAEDDDYAVLSLPAHVWRINTDPTYSTFPTMGQFYGGTCNVHSGTSTATGVAYNPFVFNSDTSSANCQGATTCVGGASAGNACTTNANCGTGTCTGGPVGGTWTAQTQDRNAQIAADGTYAKAVWVDIDLACGQCHGGSVSNTTVNNAPWISKADLATVAATMHTMAACQSTVSFTSSISQLTVNVTASVPNCSPASYDWNWGDATAHGSGAAPNHTYTAPGTYTIGLVVSDSNGLVIGSTTNSVTVTAPDNPPTASATCTWNANTWTASVTDTSTDTDATGVSRVVVSWGDGQTSVIGAGAVAQHTYAITGSYTPAVRAIDSALQSSTVVNCTGSTPFVTSLSSITGTVRNAGNTANLSSALVTLRKGSATGAIAGQTATNSLGTFTFTNLKPNTYFIVVTKSGYTFPAAPSVTVGPNSAGTVINSN